MQDLDPEGSPDPLVRKRFFPRYGIRCRADIRIVRRHHAGYLENISQGGAMVRTATPVRKLGEVLLKIPDLRPLRCQSRWVDDCLLGISFELPLSHAELSRWAEGRSFTQTIEETGIAIPEPLRLRA